MEAVTSYIKDTELRLGLPGSDVSEKPFMRHKKRVLLEDEADFDDSLPNDDSGHSRAGASPMAKTQLVGWPPIQTYRKNNFQTRKAETEADTIELFVKVSMDGAPYLRKIDLKNYKGYKELKKALDDMFKCFSIKEVLRKEYCNGCEYVMTYEDKDGDLMLVGDVPWEMFISSCKRLRIMKASETRDQESRQ
ncbi:auxin-induced protein 22D-like [Curcuma longa]|uniref:auxin-induced protein 22D-like n=1 Tax=Curcuma longa TaxID=136217 RepID=UPI003D9DE514